MRESGHDAYSPGACKMPFGITYGIYHKGRDMRVPEPSEDLQC